ncbi:MAG: hypothetical protein PHH77_01605 [Victivallaceae bacterium]|nr:hypothetical protein [Victivallaceae bacterium]
MMKAVLFGVIGAAVLNLAALDLTTVDGKVYKNVQITNVLPNAVGFFYTDKNGVTVLRDIALTSLTEDLRKKFNYSSEKAKIFERQVAVFQSERAKLLEKQRQENLALFQQQKKFARELDAVKALLYCHRVSCWVHIVRPVGTTDCIGKVSLPGATDKYGNLGTFYVRNLTGPQNDLLPAVIYPTGKSVSLQDGIFPIYDADFNKYALELVQQRENSSGGD